jgi:hypothetical protein
MPGKPTKPSAQATRHFVAKVLVQTVTDVVTHAQRVEQGAALKQHRDAAANDGQLLLFHLRHLLAVE